ncbi:UNVERIFIED_CONTAM: hypothetical protein Sangu_2941300 [Sesamum angustifolium]|uniref:Uncharacterized protein n=1 Tax=Sesamum angustifolium TaxID=2727405 RepID=A0AAW2IL49_9LAMI
MVSTEGLVPITRAFLASYYDKYPFPPLSIDVSCLSDRIYIMATDLLKDSPPTQGESLLVEEAERQPPHKVDENMWKNREQIEEILFMLEVPNWPRALQQQSTAEDAELASVLERLREKFNSTLKTLEYFQARNSEFVFNTVMTYMPQDFRGSIIRQQRERSERNKQAEVDALISSGGSIRDKYALLWKQQMERRRQLAELGSATGVYKTLMKYLVGVPEVLMDFIRQINDDQGEVFTNSPFFITAEDAGTLAARKDDDYKEINIPAGATHEVSLTVESINSYIAWDFSLVQGKMSLLILPYRRYESDQVSTAFPLYSVVLLRGIFKSLSSMSGSCDTRWTVFLLLQSLQRMLLINSYGCSIVSVNAFLHKVVPAFVSFVSGLTWSEVTADTWVDEVLRGRVGCYVYRPFGPLVLMDLGYSPSRRMSQASSPKTS